jgi:RNA polymerase sigma factor (sigma-70 family)
MRIRTGIRVEPRAVGVPCSRSLIFSDGLPHTGVVTLCNKETTGNGHHSLINDKRLPMTSADTRVSVIVGVCRQDPERWREFDAIYRPILLAYLNKRGLNDFEANDVVQDTFVKLLGKIQTYDRTKCRFQTWIFRVTHNTLVDHARRRASYKKALEGWAANVLRATPEDSIAVEQEFQRLHREKILAHAFKLVRGRVSSRSWACFQQRVLNNRPASEIAGDLKIEPNAVYVYASRVMKLVAEFCEEFDEDISGAFESDVPGRC